MYNELCSCVEITVRHLIVAMRYYYPILHCIILLKYSGNGKIQVRITYAKFDFGGLI